MIDNIFILNLPHRTDRLNFQKKQLASVWDKVTVISPITVINSSNFQNKATRSCYVSHLKILRKICYQFTNNVNLILEDDAIINDVMAIDNFVKKMKSYEWDMIYFYKRCSSILHKNDQYHRINFCLGTYGYMINNLSVKAIYNTLKQTYLNIKQNNVKLIKESHIDQVLKTHIHPNYKIITPPLDLVKHDDKIFMSDIGWQNNYVD